MTTDPWGYYSLEWTDVQTGDHMYYYYDPTGWEIVVLPTATMPQ